MKLDTAPEMGHQGLDGARPIGSALDLVLGKGGVRPGTAEGVVLSVALAWGCSCSEHRAGQAG